MPDICRKSWIQSTRLLWLSALLAGPAFAGAWGVGAFDNDAASDWVAELEESRDASALATALGGVDPAARLVDASACSVALAAAEVVAAGQGRPGKALPPEAAAWLKRLHPRVDAALAQRARTAVTFCRDNARSELRQLWSESRDFKAWLADTTALLGRLQ